MKIPALTLLLFTSFSIQAQIKTTATKSADGSSSANISMELGKPSSIVISQVNFEYPNGTSPEPLPYKKGTNKKTYILIANESTADLPKFEIDIFSGNKKLSDATLLVWLSATSFSQKLLGNGTYTYSEKNPAERGKYKFSGTVKLGAVDVPITDGWFTVNRGEKYIALKYSLTLETGVKTTGEYNLEYQTEDRSNLAVK